MNSPFICNDTLADTHLRPIKRNGTQNRMPLSGCAAVYGVLGRESSRSWNICLLVS